MKRKLKLISCRSFHFFCPSSYFTFALENRLEIAKKKNCLRSNVFNSFFLSLTSLRFQCFHLNETYIEHVEKHEVQCHIEKTSAKHKSWNFNYAFNAFTWFTFPTVVSVVNEWKYFYFFLKQKSTLNCSVRFSSVSSPAFENQFFYVPVNLCLFATRILLLLRYRIVKSLQRR